MKRKRTQRPILNFKLHWLNLQSVIHKMERKIIFTFHWKWKVIVLSKCLIRGVFSEQSTKCCPLHIQRSIQTHIWSSFQCGHSTWRDIKYLWTQTKESFKIENLWKKINFPHTFHTLKKNEKYWKKNTSKFARLNSIDGIK